LNRVDPEVLQRTIQMLAAESDDRFSEALADCIMDPVQEEVEAFRSPELIVRSVAAARYLIDHVNTIMRTRSGPDASSKDLRRRTEAFRNKVGRERRLLEEIQRSLELQRGIIRNAPNPRARAMKRLWQLNLAGDVPMGTAARLLEEEQEKVVIAKREARRAAKEAARAARQGVSHL
jgi:hypothetical protein